MFKRLGITLVLFAGLLVLADRGLATVSGNAAADQIKLHEGLREDPDVTFRGFPFTTQAVRGKFANVDITIRDLERGGLTIDRIDAHLEDVRIDFGDVLKGRVHAVPVERGEATARVTYGDLGTFLSSKPGNIRLVVREGEVFVVSTFGIPGVGPTDVEGRPTVRFTETSVRVVVSDVQVVGGTRTLSVALAAQAAARASFTIPFDELPFGIEVESARLTPTALVVEAAASGFVVGV